MIEDIEFHGIGKNTFHKAPEGFFENISERTLQKAKQREQMHHKRLILWKRVSIAASLAAAIFIGYLIFNPVNQDSKQIVLKKQSIEQQILLPESIKHKSVTEKTIAGENNTEGLGDVLHDLSDEELLQIAAVYNTDPFIGDSEQ